MSKGSFKTLCTVEGINYYFSPKKFQTEVDSYLKRKNTEGKYTKARFYKEAGDLIGLTDGAVKQWYLGKNGPSDINMVYIVSSILGIDSNNLLVKQSKQEETMRYDKNILYSTSDRKSVVKAVYLALLDFVDLVLESNNGVSIPDCPTIEDPNQISDYYDEKLFSIRKMIDAAVFDMPYEEIIRLHALISEVEDDFRNPGYSLRWNKANPLFLVAKEIMDCETFEEMVESLDADSFESIMRDYFRGAEPMYKFNIVIGNPVLFSVGVIVDPGEDPMEFAKKMVDSFRENNGDEEYSIEENRAIRVCPSPKAIYRNQFSKLILSLLREDFPDCIPPIYRTVENSNA